MIHITDMDRIERSNLSRQFLFRERHIGELKSTTAAQAAQAMNPSLNIRAYDLAVGKATEVDFNEVCMDSLRSPFFFFFFFPTSFFGLHALDLPRRSQQYVPLPLTLLRVCVCVFALSCFARNLCNPLMLL